MKIFLSITYLTLIVFCALLWLFAAIECRSIEYVFGDKPLPWFTYWFVVPHRWILFVPALWLPAFVYILRMRPPTLAAALIFQSTALFAAAVVFALVALGGSVVWMQFYGGLGPIKPIHHLKNWSGQ